MNLFSRWPIFTPILGAIVLGFLYQQSMSSLLTGVAILVMLLTVITSVHHAEVIAHRLGEPYGTLVLALAVTVIETALILSLMLLGTSENPTLPRDTVYSAVMIICNGVVGLCLLLGGINHREQVFRIEGTGSGFAALVTLSMLVLIMPVLTTSSPGATYTNSQLIFVAAASLILWLVFVFIQTIRHRDYFLPSSNTEDETVHCPPPSLGQAWMSFGLLLVSLVCVVGYAKTLAPGIEQLVTAMQAPPAFVGILVAMIVLLPETWAALRAALSNRLQTSMNLAIGSALASIGLTIPLVVLASVLLDLKLVIGIDDKDIAMLSLTFLVGSITLGSGRTNLMQGAIHLIIFAAFLFLTLVP